MDTLREDRGERISRRAKQAIVLLAIIAGIFVVAEHLPHLIPYLPLLLLAACPLMHVFMHRGHGSHDHHESDGGAKGGCR